jgi:hypothetical protein
MGTNSGLLFLPYDTRPDAPRGESLVKRSPAFISAVLSVFFATAATPAAPTALAQDAKPPVDRKASQKEYAGRLSAVEASEFAGRVRLAEWCAEVGLNDEAVEQLGISVKLAPGTPPSVSSWLKLADRIPVSQAVVRVVFDDGGCIRGTAAMHPLVVSKEGEALLVPLGRLKLLTQTVKGIHKVETFDGTFTGAVKTPALIVKCYSGELSVPFDRLVRLTVEGCPGGRPVADPLVEMRSCFETVGKVNDGYALYGAAEFFTRAHVPDALLVLARNYLKIGADAIAGDRTKYAPMKLTAPIAADRVVLRDGTQLVGQIKARSPDLISIEVMTAKGLEIRNVRPADVRTVDKTAVPPDQMNANNRARVARDFVTAGQAGRYVTLLDAWGKLCHEFPEENWAKTLSGMLMPADATPDALAADKLLEKATTWAGIACPLCVGSKQLSCEACRARGKVMVQEVCPRCKGADPQQCPWCQGTSKTTCPVCNGSGRVKTAISSGFDATEGCDRCGGQGKVTCTHCRKGVIVCPGCENRGKVNVERPCQTCSGKGAICCTLCGGSGERKEPAPTPLAAPPPEKFTKPGNPSAGEFATRLRKLADDQFNERLDLTRWCLDRELTDEAQAQLARAFILDAKNPKLVPAWTRLVDVMPGTDTQVTVTLDDGTTVIGTTPLRPFLVQHKDGFAVVLLEKLKWMAPLTHTPGGNMSKFQTSDGMLEGKLIAPPMKIKALVGQVTVSFDHVRSFLAAGMSATEPPPTPAAETPAPAPPKPEPPAAEPPKPETPETDTVKTENPGEEDVIQRFDPDPPKPDKSKPNQPKPEPPKAEPPKPEAPKPEPPKPEPLKPDVPKPDEPKKDNPDEDVIEEVK